MGRKTKRRVDPGLELARSDTERIRKLSSRAEETDAVAHLESSIYEMSRISSGDTIRASKLFAAGKSKEARALLAKSFKKYGGNLDKAIEEGRYARSDLKNAPFEMLKLLEAAERKHGKPFREKKSGRGALLTKEAAERLLRIRNRSK